METRLSEPLDGPSMASHLSAACRFRRRLGARIVEEPPRVANGYLGTCRFRYNIGSGSSHCRRPRGRP